MQSMTARRAGHPRTTRGRAGQRTHLVINLLWPFLKYSNIQTCKSMIQLYFCASQIDTNRYTLTSVRPRSDPFYNIFYQASCLNQMHKMPLVCESWFVGCNRGACINCTPAAFQYPLIRLRFLFCSINYLLWFGALFLG